jgi:thiol:disulfide interchange protein DsbD
MRFRRVLSRVSPVVALLCAATGLHTSHLLAQQVVLTQQVVRVPLSYRAAREGVTRPNFSPKGTQVALTDVGASFVLPAGAVRPAKSGVIKVGPSPRSWIPVLASASAAFPSDLTQLWLDRNRDGRFDDDGPPLTGKPTQRATTKAWWTSIDKIELSVPYATGSQLYFVNFWMVREDSAAAPSVLRYSTGSWRYGTVVVNGVPALVAAMDADNDALFGKDDMWSVLSASAPKAEAMVLNSAEARETKRLMFLPAPDGGASARAAAEAAASTAKEQVLQFRRFAPDGSFVEFAVVDVPVTKAQDRAPDDLLREERPRPRTETAVVWGHGASGLDAALALAKTSGKRIFLDFEAVWCGPCHTMDEWIWTDSDVAAALNSGYIGVKIDVDVNKPLVARFKTTGYPTMIILNPDGTELKRVVEYQSSKAMLALLAK